MAAASKEKRFLKALEDLFTGAEVEGDSGFVNLMRMKRTYFQSIRPQLMAEIDQRAEKYTHFRDELFDKLYTFFHRYFCESGSIYFRHLPAFAKTYERVYADGQDVALSWKTQMLYYVKSDVLVRSMPVELHDEDAPQNDRRFFFDAAAFTAKQNNEKRAFVFRFVRVDKETRPPTIHLAVAYSERGSRTSLDEIIRGARKARTTLTEEQLQQAISVFRRQTEADFFINKDAKGFLREQFDLWAYQYMFTERTIFEEQRIKQLQAIQEVAYFIIDFIAQFEEELRRVWEKPKFVRRLNYVITLDKLSDAALKKIIQHKNAKAQIKEWRALGMVDNGFVMKNIFNGQRSIEDTNGANGNYKFLPLDTRHFKDMEIEILEGLGNLDEALDGELVHSENWQALNTLQERYREKVKCIYIDPPFNLDSSDQFEYRTNYKDSCWATMLKNRISLAHDYLSDDGAIFIRCDYNGNWIVRCLLDDIFNKDNFRNEIIVKRGYVPAGNFRQLSTANDFLFMYAKRLASFNMAKNTRPISEEERRWISLDMPGQRSTRDKKVRTFFGEEMFPPKGQHWGLSQKRIDELSSRGDIRINPNKKYVDTENRSVIGMPEYLKEPYILLNTNWDDISGYTTHNTFFPTENSEELLRRTTELISGEENELCIDFFAGSGTTQAVAQKLGRKWLGVEMGEHFHTVVLPRMKKVLSGHQSGISKETEYRGGGFFKYYALEQYEETLKNARYKDGEQLELDSTKSPFEQYVFFGDDKLAHAVNVQKNGKLKINLHHLYPDIDIAESLANILGKTIRKRTADGVTFTDGSSEKTNPTKMTEAEKQHFIALIKPYLWWGE